ncbi:MAG: hypothetical protein E7253_07760 [Lachnospiraceae bacterium]|nr:hypothetical protein [Lachnospiraceae bacterium]
MDIKNQWKHNFNYIKTRYKRFRIGLRTIKTAAAVIISMLIIAAFGLSSTKMIFAMLGAMATMETTFKGSLEACFTQVIGLIFGTILGILLLSMPFPHMLDAGIGIVLVITLYNAFQIRYSPALPCLIVVIMCTTPDIAPLEYAIGRLWASGVGLFVGLAINTLVFPYDNSNKIKATIDYLDKELLLFLEDMFDGDDHLPDTVKMAEMIDDMKRQLKIFSGQSFILRKTKKKRQMEIFKTCVGKERELIAHMEVLSQLSYPGRLYERNRERLLRCGADIKKERKSEKENYVNEINELDVITNYHVEQLLMLRSELMDELKVILDL